MINTGLFTSNTDLWSTPQDFFDKLDQEFNFTLDPCANKENTKCDKFFTQEEDGLTKSWDNEIVFCNPPYGTVLKNWVKKASEAQGGDSSNAHPIKDRYSLLSRIYLSKGKCRNSFPKRSLEIWRFKKLCPISINGCYF